ncbi:MAG: DUF3419 family protein [Planctomycetota bacterium]|jgi:S-adenosylmethionine-diacylglycerol 3-amino-3-carboxypropyl transferase
MTGDGLALRGKSTRGPLQFAVVREDPRLELALIEEFALRRPLLVASGGCTALAVRAANPDLEIHLVEPNPAQRVHLEHKLERLAGADPGDFGVENEDPRALHECGNFEALFRQWRSFLDEFVISPEGRTDLITAEAPDLEGLCNAGYWSVSFELMFSDALLVEMFGPDAIQHAPRGSYPGYFRARIEGMLRDDDRQTNPWLGRYLPDEVCWPPFLRGPRTSLAPFTTHAGTFDEVESFADFDLLGLSNVLDWTDPAACERLVVRLASELRPGARVLWRELNDPRPLDELFRRAGFRLDREVDTELTARERSGFYSEVHLAVRT